MSFRFLLLCALLEFTVSSSEVGPGFSCRYGEDRSACLQNKDGYQCCTDQSGPPESYCSGGLNGPPGGSGNLDCGSTIWGVHTGVSYKCCKKQGGKGLPTWAIVLISVGGSCLVLITIAAIAGIAKAYSMPQTPQPPVMQMMPMSVGQAMPSQPVAMGMPSQPAGGAKFDPMTGKPIPKFDPNTGVQNWSSDEELVSRA